MPNLSNLKFTVLVIGTLSIFTLPAQANPHNNEYLGDRKPQLVAGNNQPVRRYGRDRIALETEINTKSGNAETALAKHLAQKGVKFYGAYWCPHCHNQKELFGQEALRLLPYVECSADGQNSQRQLCKQKNITLFPSWEINGKIVPGTQSLKTLAEITGYQGPKNFRNR